MSEQTARDALVDSIAEIYEDQKIPYTAGQVTEAAKRHLAALDAAGFVLVRTTADGRRASEDGAA